MYPFYSTDRHEPHIEYAWSNNLSIKQQNIEVSRSEAQLLQDKLDFAPSLNVSFGHNLNWGRSVDLQNLEIIHNKLSQSTSASANASIYLLDGLSKLYGLKSSQKSLEISIQEVERLKDEISVSIAKSYLQILLAREILAAAEESFHSLQEQRDRTRLLVEAGSQPYTSLLDIESQLASERVQVVTAESQVRTNTLALQQLLDLQYSPDFRIAVPDIDYIIQGYTADNIDEIYAGALSMPVIQSARLALDKGELDLKSAKGQHLRPGRKRISVLRAVPGQHQSVHNRRPEYPDLQQLERQDQRQKRQAGQRESGTGAQDQGADSIQGDTDCRH